MAMHYREVARKLNSGNQRAECSEKFSSGVSATRTFEFSALPKVRKNNNRLISTKQLD
jgi:hypothetical protein